MKNTREIKTASQLKNYHESLNPDSHYFTRKTMKFFGDTMANYRVSNKPDYIELYRKNAVKNGLHTSAYFEHDTLERIINLDNFLINKGK